MAPIFMYFYNSSFVLGTNEKIEFEELTINFKQEENIFLQTDLTFNVNSGVKSYIYIGLHKSKSCSSVMEHEDLLNLLMAMRTCLKNRASKTHKEDIEKLVIYGGLIANNCAFYLFEMVLKLDDQFLYYRARHISFNLLTSKDCAALFINLQQIFNKIWQTTIRPVKQKPKVLNTEKAKKQTYSTFKRIINFKDFCDNELACFMVSAALNKANKINSSIDELLKKHKIDDNFNLVNKLSNSVSLFFSERFSEHYRILVIIIEESIFSSYVLQNCENIGKDSVIFIAYKVGNRAFKIQQAKVLTEYARELLNIIHLIPNDALQINEENTSLSNASLNISENSKEVQQQRNESFTNCEFLFNDLNLDYTFGKFKLSNIWNVSEITKSHCTCVYLIGRSILKNECEKIFMKMTRFKDNLLPSDLVLKLIMQNNQSKNICKIFRSDFICHDSELVELLKFKGYFLDFDNLFKGNEGIYYTVCEKLEDKSVFLKLLTSQKSLKCKIMLLLTFFENCLKGLQYLHKESNIVHGDLSGENILFRPILGNTNTNNKSDNSNNNNSNDKSTFPYQPVLEVKDLKQKDLYSLGIIFAEYIRFLMEGELEFLSFDFEPNEWDFLFAASKYKKSIINFFTEKINGLKGLEKD
ncbi:hypothetical protein ABK040_001997 [Willaertia magna]